MDEEEKANVRAWKRGMEEMNRIVREENRRRTPEERLKRALFLMDSRNMWRQQPPPLAGLTPEQERWLYATRNMRDTN